VSVSPCGDLRHRPALGGLIVDVRQHHGRDIAIDRLRQLGARPHAQLDPIAEQRRDALQHVEVGWKVAGLGEDDFAAGPEAQGAARQLEQIDRGRVRHDHLVGRRADQRRDLGPDALRGADPVVRVPAADEADAPLVLDGRGHPPGGCAGRSAQGVAVQVDHARRQDERRAERRQGVGGVAQGKVAPAQLRNSHLARAL